MNGLEIVRHLYAWTPYLLGGFLWNIAISLVALAMGTAVGHGLASMRGATRGHWANGGRLATALLRNVPTFVFQFYLVFMLPEALPLPFSLPNLPLPAWLKASLALALAVAGFVSDNLSRILAKPPSERRRDLLLLLLNWGNYFVIIVMASSTASVIGVPELISRCNTVVNAGGTTDMMLWVYLYAMGWFFLFCCSASGLIRYCSRHLERRLGMADLGQTEV